MKLVFAIIFPLALLLAFVDTPDDTAFYVVKSIAGGLLLISIILAKKLFKQ